MHAQVSYVGYTRLFYKHCELCRPTKCVKSMNLGLVKKVADGKKTNQPDVSKFYERHSLTFCYPT